MIELARHIEVLLLDNDCVIVPELGGFVAHQVSARYDQDDHTWLPPMRTLGFNPQLRINDSLLVQSYVNAYDISYPEALRRIEDEVDEVKNQLDEKGCYQLENIGTLTINADGNYVFEPCEAGILSPDYYGLGTCDFLTLKEQREVEVPVPVPAPTPELLEFLDDDSENENSDRTIQIKMSWIRNTAAVAAAIIAFFIMATPIANSDLRTRTMSQLQNNLLYKLIPQDTNMTPATPVVDTIAAQTAQVEKQAATPVSPAPTKLAESPMRPYCIVLASHVKMSNAEDYVKKLKAHGYEDAEVYEHNNVVRVVFGAYKTEEEAYQQLKKMNNQDEFSEAWVYKKKASKDKKQEAIV